MSKAIKWANRLRAAREELAECDGQPPCVLIADGSSLPKAWVDVDGSPYFNLKGKIDVADALRIAHWILDTFGEPDTAP